MCWRSGSIRVCGRRDEFHMKIFGKTVAASAVGGGLIVVALAGLVLLAPLVAPHGETETVGDIWLLPGAEHLLGPHSSGRARCFGGCYAAGALRLASRLQSACSPFPWASSAALPPWCSDATSICCSRVWSIRLWRFPC